MGLAGSKPRNVLSHPPTAGHDKAYALVTGATSGIGRSLAVELCRRGLNVIVHGRDPVRLDALIKDLREQYPSRDIRGLVLDAATAFTASGETGQEAWNALFSITDLNLKILVNNVGIGHNPTKDFITFTEQTPAQITQLIQVNISFMTFLTYALLPTLQRNATTNSPSFVMNSGSLAELGLPWVSVYSGTKGYITAFSKALDTELKGEGKHVEVISALIGDTDSDGHKVGTSLFTPSSDNMASMILDSAAGTGAVARVPYWGHLIQLWLCKLQPYRLLQKGMIYNVTGLREKNGLVAKKQA
ncbi:uncharacterized protein NECHADRAFT_82502 [Fusarium vanettenii 77-13-4]|uniref:NAD(P)-binding protein n=1 Tax=Fusarium vanettenii (strain ATCC MYA-4622 / CBS 123669 / FGSC 9596 / NRRL 45880 / 77-13-4) TaxID=660122 RepID=C7YXE6_FUSV7|nr:uncharacterized protein NECHADRAFT_82502 [Fusarium vanettenii 77-13-4]EEU43576.1 hypothetical protein NECHADRAFT_82502 [Fusarium vanettenii 77-13-4]